MDRALRQQPARKPFGRKEIYNAVANLKGHGLAPTVISRVIGQSVEAVNKYVEVMDWSQGKRNAWLIGLNVDKFNCV